VSIVVFSTQQRNFSLVERADLIPLAAHLVDAGFNEMWRGEILGYVAQHGTLTPRECWDSQEDYDAASLFLPQPPIAGGAPVDAPKSQYSDAEWARRNQERDDES
jgi:hypothetical protein